MCPKIGECYYSNIFFDFQYTIKSKARIYSRCLGLPLRKGSLLRFIDVPYRIRRPLNLPKEVFF